MGFQAAFIITRQCYTNKLASILNTEVQNGEDLSIRGIGIFKKDVSQYGIQGMHFILVDTCSRGYLHDLGVKLSKEFSIDLVYAEYMDNNTIEENDCMNDSVTMFKVDNLISQKDISALRWESIGIPDECSSDNVKHSFVLKSQYMCNTNTIIESLTDIDTKNEAAFEKVLSDTVLDEILVRNKDGFLAIRIPSHYNGLGNSEYTPYFIESMLEHYEGNLEAITDAISE